jgi:hypothetical protein
VDRKPRVAEGKNPCECTLPLEAGKLGCGEDCLNRCVFMECDESCPLGNRCSNKRIQKRASVKDIEIVEVGYFFTLKEQHAKEIEIYRQKEEALGW